MDSNQTFEAFHNRLFVDDCDLNVKIQALSQIQDMFREETATLVAFAEEETEDEEV